jgi:hypothetical protein
MKLKLIFLVLGLATVFIVGCSKRNNINPYQTAIVGKWGYTADTITYYYNGKINGIIPGSSVGTNNTYEFNNNGTGVKAISNVLVSFTYSLVANQLTINLPPYAINTTEVRASVESALVNTLNATDMSLYFDSNVLDESGLDDETQEHAYFKKQ